MKYLFMALMAALVSTQAFAGVWYDCAGNQSGMSVRVLARDPVDGNPATLTVKFNGRTVYSVMPVVSDSRGSVQTFQSPTFRNGNRAPASLFLQIYRSEEKLMGGFSEQSFLPVVPSVELVCRYRHG